MPEAKVAGLVKGSLSIAGHRTSLSLEPVFWTALRAAAAARSVPVNAIVTEIDEARTTNLSSAVRVWLFKQALASCFPPAFTGGEQQEVDDC